MHKFLFRHIDNTGLVLFRIVFGLLIAIEAFGSIATGWVRMNLIEPQFTFNFIGFEFLQPLPGQWMYLYFVIMGMFGLFVMLGYKYRISMLAYALLWSAVYLMQKTAYNNHYYLMMMLCWLMAFMPANQSLSIDARQNKEIRSSSMPRWCLLIMMLQVWIVYTFASVAKIYPDWLDTTVVELFMKGKKEYWLIGEFLQLKWVHYVIAYTGILFDLLIVPLLLWRRTRVFGFAISIFFHLFNSIVFQIGIFPYMSIAFAFFFFSSETLQKRFKLTSIKDEIDGVIKTHKDLLFPTYKNLWIGIFGIYFLIQLALPLRHWFFKDDVLWTEEGHRLSWRMMLRSKSGAATIWVVEKGSGERRRYDQYSLLANKQQSAYATKPDLLWQLAQYIKASEAKEGRDVGVYMDVKVNVNGGEYHPFIDPKVDLAAEKWYPFKHHDWILPSPENYHKK